MPNHKKWVEEVFDRTAAEYGTRGASFFNYFGKRLVEEAKIKSGEQVLDVAMGTGASLFPAAEICHVTGIDISNQMVQEAIKKAKELNINQVDFKQMDAEDLKFPDNSFDCLLCGFGLFFFPSLPKALSEFKRVLKPNGRLAVSIWGQRSPLSSEIKKLVPGDGLIVGPIQLEKALKDAGFKNIRIVEEKKTFYHKSAEEWWQSLWSHAIRALFEKLPPDQLNAVHQKALEIATSFADEKGIPEELHVYYALAKR